MKERESDIERERVRERDREGERVAEKRYDVGLPDTDMPSEWTYNSRRE